MRRGCAAFNDVPPVFIRTTPDCMDDSTNLFLHAVITELYVMELSKLTRNDIEYTAGDAVVAIDRPRIEHLKTLIKYHGDIFRDTASSYKQTINFHRGYRHY